MHGFFPRFFFKEYVDIACISKTLIMQNFNLQDFLISHAAVLGKSHKILQAEIIQKDDARKYLKLIWAKSLQNLFERKHDDLIGSKLKSLVN